MDPPSQESRRPSLARLKTFGSNFSFFNKKRKISSDSAISGIFPTTATPGVVQYIGTPYPPPPSSSPSSFPSSLSTQEPLHPRHTRADGPVMICQTRENNPLSAPLTSQFSDISAPSSSPSEYSNTSPSLSGAFLDPRSPPKPNWMERMRGGLERRDRVMDSTLEARRKRRLARKRREQRAAEAVARENITDTVVQVSSHLSQGRKEDGPKRRFTLKRKDKEQGQERKKEDEGNKSKDKGNEESKDEGNEKSKDKLKKEGGGKSYLFPVWMVYIPFWARRKPASTAGKIISIPPREGNDASALLSQPGIQRKRSLRHPAKEPLVASGTIPRTWLARGDEVIEEDEGSAEERAWWERDACVDVGEDDTIVKAWWESDPPPVPTRSTHRLKLACDPLVRHNGRSRRKSTGPWRTDVI